VVMDAMVGAVAEGRLGPTWESAQSVSEPTSTEPALRGHRGSSEVG
jgi:hypothetical protein